MLLYAVGVENVLPRLPHVCDWWRCAFWLTDGFRWLRSVVCDDRVFVIISILFQLRHCIDHHCCTIVGSGGGVQQSEIIKVFNFNTFITFY